MLIIKVNLIVTRENTSYQIHYHDINVNLYDDSKNLIQISYSDKQCIFSCRLVLNRNGPVIQCSHIIITPTPQHTHIWYFDDFFCFFWSFFPCQKNIVMALFPVPTLPLVYLIYLSIPVYNGPLVRENVLFSGWYALFLCLKNVLFLV